MKFPIRMKSTKTHSERKNHMSLTHCIRTSIDLKDKNIFFEENFCQEKSIKGLTAKAFDAILTYTPKACHSCGVKNQEAKIVKNGFLKTRIK